MHPSSRMRKDDTMYTFKSVQHFMLYLQDIKTRKGISIEEAYVEHFNSLHLGPPVEVDYHELRSLFMARIPNVIGYTNILGPSYTPDISRIGILMIFDPHGPVYCRMATRDSLVMRHEIDEVDCLKPYSLKVPEDILKPLDLQKWKELTTAIRSDDEEAYCKLIGCVSGIDIAGGDDHGKI